MACLLLCLLTAEQTSAAAFPSFDGNLMEIGNLDYQRIPKIKKKILLEILLEIPSFGGAKQVNHGNHQLHSLLISQLLEVSSNGHKLVDVSWLVDAPEKFFEGSLVSACFFRCFLT